MRILTGNNSKREPLIVRANRSTVLTFSLEEEDVGGTLAVELAIYNKKGITNQLGLRWVRPGNQ